MGFPIWAFLLSLGPWLAEAEEPELDVMYLRYKQQPIDTSPVFNRKYVEYNATMDYKMGFFAVQASPLGAAVITNIFLCPDADCHRETPRAIADFSRKVSLEPGERTLYKFDVELLGRARTYSITITRLTGKETDLRHLVVQGSTLYPPFQPQIRSYRCFLDVQRDVGLLELHLQDQGQTVLAEAEAPVPLASDDNITSLDNTHPQQLRSPPIRLLREEAYGEFQYPNKYLEFPVPMGTKRKLRFKVVSSDGGHFGYYQLDLARQECSTEMPLFDVRSGRCVRFCNLGYWADFAQSRCKRCPDLCVSCVSGQKCLSCRRPTIEMDYLLDPETGRCTAKLRPFWQKNAEQAISIALGTAALLLFLCGLLAFALARRRQEAEGRSAKARSRVEMGKYSQLPSEDMDF